MALSRDSPPRSSLPCVRAGARSDTRWGTRALHAATHTVSVRQVAAAAKGVAASAARARTPPRTGPRLNALCSPSHSPLGDAAARARIDGASSSTRTAAPPPRAHLACPSRPPIRRPARAPRGTNRATFERFVLSLSLPLGDAAAAARAQQQRSSSSTPTPPAPPPPSSPLRTISHDLAAAHDLARSRRSARSRTISPGACV